MGTNGMYRVIEVMDDMPMKTSVIFGSGGALWPDQLGSSLAVLVWSD
jgi:hypothetical protein